jgi:WD40 repeat protein
LLASASWDQTAKIWDLATGEPKTTLQESDQVWSLDATKLMSASDDETIKIWDTAAGQCTLTLVGHGGRVSAVGVTTTAGQYSANKDYQRKEGNYNSNSTWLATSALDKTIKIWNAATEVCVLTLQDDNKVDIVAWSPDGTTLASLSSTEQYSNGVIKIWDAATGKHLRTLDATGFRQTSWRWFWDPDNSDVDIETVGWSPDSTKFASGSKCGKVSIWDVATSQGKSIGSHSGCVTSVAWSQDGKCLATGSLDNTVMIWDAVTGVCRRRLTGHTDEVLTVSWAPGYGTDLFTPPLASRLETRREARSMDERHDRLTRPTLPPRTGDPRQVKEQDGGFVE